MNWMRGYFTASGISLEPGGNNGNSIASIGATRLVRWTSFGSCGGTPSHSSRGQGRQSGQNCFCISVHCGSDHIAEYDMRRQLRR